MNNAPLDPFWIQTRRASGAALWNDTGLPQSFLDFEAALANGTAFSAPPTQPTDSDNGAST